LKNFKLSKIPLSIILAVLGLLQVALTALFGGNFKEMLIAVGCNNPQELAEILWALSAFIGMAMMVSGFLLFVKTTNKTGEEKSPKENKNTGVEPLFPDPE